MSAWPLTSCTCGVASLLTRTSMNSSDFTDGGGGVVGVVAWWACWRGGRDAVAPFVLDHPGGDVCLVAFDVGADVGRGRGRDAVALFVLDHPGGDVCLVAFDVGADVGRGRR